MAPLGHGARQRKIVYGASSDTFNLRSWQSVSEELGGAPAFWALVAQHQPAPAPTTAWSR